MSGSPNPSPKEVQTQQPGMAAIPHPMEGVAEPSLKTGILLLNMGGPDCPESVEPFLYNLFSDPDIIRLPFSDIFQKPLAKYISSSRGDEARHNYLAMGGASPILPFTQGQGDALKVELTRRSGKSPDVYIAMRYWYPFTEAAVNALKRDGIERVIAVPMYPHFSHTTTGSSLNELRRRMEARQYTPELVLVPPYYDHPSYLAAVAEGLSEGLDAHPWTCDKDDVTILFSAHSLPLKHVSRTKDPYPEQIIACTEQIMKQFFPNNPWELCYQSKVGNMRWLGPSTEGALHYLAGKNINNILITAISFVSDHVETLVEIDRDYLGLAKVLKIPQCYRAPSLNLRPSFIQALADITQEAIAGADEAAKQSDQASLWAGGVVTAAEDIAAIQGQVNPSVATVIQPA